MIIRIGQNYNVSVWHKLLASLKLSISKVCIKEQHTRNDLNSRCNNFRKKFDAHGPKNVLQIKLKSDLQVYSMLHTKNHLNVSKKSLNFPYLKLTYSKDNNSIYKKRN